MDPLTDSQREALRTEAMLHPAPDLPSLKTRPFNDTVLALCKEAGLTLFTLEAFDGDVTGKEDMVARASALGVAELNRQCLCLLFIVGCPDVKGMLKAVRSPSFYDQVIEWSLDLPSDPDRMANIFGEWQRYMLHTAASLVKVLPKDNDTGPTPPPNS
jgi:hypothetical protein